MRRSLAIGFVCVLGLGLFACAKDEDPPANNGNAAGTAPAGASGTTGGGAGGMDGSASGAGAATSGAGAMGGAMAGTTGGEAGTGSGGVGGGDTDGSVAGSGGMSGGAAQWTMMGYDATNTYWQPSETAITVDNAGTLEEKWVFPIAGYPPGSPVIANGKVYVLATGGLYAINLADGTEAWKDLTIMGTATVAYADGAIYVHSQTANLYRLNAETGAVMWGPVKTFDFPGADGTSSPIVASGKVIVGHSTSNEVAGTGADRIASKGGVEAFNADDGTPAWTYDTPEGDENGAMVWSTVGVDVAAGIVFASTGNNYTVAGANSDAIHAINIADGTSAWKKQVRANDVWSFSALAGQDTDFGANPILAEIGGSKIVAAGDKGSAFWVLDRENGDIKWSRENLSSSHSPANGGMLNNGAFDGTTFYVVSNQPPGAAVLHALKAEDGLPDLWPAKTLNAITWGTVTGANGVLFVPSGTILRVYNAATGAELTMFDTGGTIAAGGASIVDGKVVVQSGLSYPLDATALPNNEIHCYGLPD